MIPLGLHNTPCNFTSFNVFQGTQKVMLYHAVLAQWQALQSTNRTCVSSTPVGRVMPQSIRWNAGKIPQRWPTDEQHESKLGKRCDLGPIITTQRNALGKDAEAWLDKLPGIITCFGTRNVEGNHGDVRLCSIGDGVTGILTVPALVVYKDSRTLIILLLKTWELMLVRFGT